MKTLSILATLSLTGAALAQSTAIVPIDNTDPSNPALHLEGASSTSRYPVANGISRVMYIYETADQGRTLLAVPDQAQITAIEFPRDVNATSTGYIVVVEVKMGPTMKTAATAEATFASNHTAPLTTVFARRQLTLPNLGPGSGRMTINLDAPYTFDASQNLIVEYTVHANSNGNAPFTYRLDWDYDRSASVTTGAGCAHSGSRVPRLTSTAAAVSENWRLTLSSAPFSTAHALLIGFQPLAVGIPIPGAPGCDLLVNPRVAVSGMTGTNGSHSWNFPLSSDMVFWNRTIYTQVVATDLFANPLGVVMSNVNEMTIGLNPRIALIQASGTAATSGSVNRSYGQITYFRYN